MTPKRMRRVHNFSRDAGSVAEARRFAADALAGGDPDVVSSVELMVSELATNCIRHTDSEFELAVEHEQGQIRIEVSDQGGGEPVLLSPSPDDPNGRGLQIVDMLSRDWGVERSAAPGKTVWFELSATAPAAAEDDDVELSGRPRGA